jgi:hypothetical protein
VTRDERPTYYKLLGKVAVPCGQMEWSRWFEHAGTERIVAKTTVGPMVVSTVFIGLDHNWQGGEPHLFETMIFDGTIGAGGEALDMDRCSTWGQAESMHAQAVAWAADRLACAKAALKTRC